MDYLYSILERLQDSARVSACSAQRLSETLIVSQVPLIFMVYNCWEKPIIEFLVIEPSLHIA